MLNFTSMKTKLPLTIILLFAFSLLHAQVRRYVENIAASSTVTTDVVYGQAPFLNGLGTNETSTSQGDLVMDIYTPSGDAHDLRAAIIFAHAGGFFNGNRNHDDMVALCDSFARKGYVTATIDYRKGFWPLSDAELHGTRAVYRGIQDGRTAVRYFRANAASLGVDPDQIYLAGSSAGGFIALHGIYMTELAEVPPETGEVQYVDFLTTRTTPDLGPPDAGSNTGVSGTPNGVVNLWGAVASIDLVDATDDQPIFLAHGTADATVPFVSGPPFGFTGFPDVFGSGPISDQLTLNGTADFETYFVPGGEHEFYGTDNGTWSNGIGPNAYWDTLLPRITQFLWRQHKPVANFTFDADGLTADFTDASSGALAWFWDFGDGTTSTLTNPDHTYPAAGDYPVALFVQNDLLSWDTLEQVVTVEAALPLNWTSPLWADYDGKDVQLRWSVSEQVNTDRFVIEHATDGRNFTDLGELPAAGTLASAASYAYRHASPASGLHYYRIRQVDLDGHSSFSTLASVEAGEELRLFPNPTAGEVRLTGLPAATREVEVMDMAGRRIRQLTLEADGRLDLTGLRSGNYWLRPAGMTTVLKVVLQ